MKKCRNKKLYTIFAALFFSVGVLTTSGCAEVMDSVNSAVNSVVDSLEEESKVEYEDDTVDDGYVYTRTIGCNTYYYDLLTEKQQRFYRKIRIDLDKFFAGEREAIPYRYLLTRYNVLGHYPFEPFGITHEEGMQAFDALYQDCPQYYAYDSVYLLSTSEGLSPVIADEYKDKSARDAMDVKIAESVSTIEPLMVDGYTDFDKFSVLYDYVNAQVYYEYNWIGVPSMNAHTGNIVGVLDGDSETNAICAGYSFALTYLCNIFGLECISVGNVALNHEWNAVKIDGVWYYTDATNDDGNEQMTLLLCSEDTFWDFFWYDEPIYDIGVPDTVGRVEFLPPVSKSIGYSRFLMEKGEVGYTAVGPLIDQYYLRVPAVYKGEPVVAIGKDFVSWLTRVEIIVLPSSIRTIGAQAFSKGLSRIYYEGTPEEFSAIQIGANNDALKQAKVYYYSEKRPVKNIKNYWYYGEDGYPKNWASEQQGGNYEIYG